MATSSAGRAKKLWGRAGKASTALGVAAVAWFSRHPGDIRLKWAILELITLGLAQAMSEEQLKAFWEAVQADAGLQEKLSAAKDADAVVAIAKAAGFEISEEELARAQTELSDEQLSGAWGGGDDFWYKIGRAFFSGACQGR